MQTVVQWANAKIFCISSSYPSWFYKGKSINKFKKNPKSWAPIKEKYNFHKDKTNYTLTIHNMDYNDVGEYECQGTNNFGNKFYTVSRLYVRGKCANVSN